MARTKQTARQPGAPRRHAPPAKAPRTAKGAPSTAGIPAPSSDNAIHKIVKVRCVRGGPEGRGSFECQVEPAEGEDSDDTPHIYCDLRTWHRCGVGFLVALRGEDDASEWVDVSEMQVLLWDKLLELDRGYGPRKHTTDEVMPTEVMAVVKENTGMYYIKVGAIGKPLEKVAVLENYLVIEDGRRGYYSTFRPTSTRDPPAEITTGARNLLVRLRDAIAQMEDWWRLC